MTYNTALPFPPPKKEDLWIIFRSLPSASRLGQCFLAAAGCQKMFFFLVSWLMCLKVVASNFLLISKAWGSTLPWLPKQWCCARDGRPVKFVGVGLLVSMDLESFSNRQPGSGGYLYDESASGLWHTEPCLHSQKWAKWKNQNKKECHGDRPAAKVFATWIGTKPMSQLCAEAKATRKTTARQGANVIGAARVKHGPWWLFP